MRGPVGSRVVVAPMSQNVPASLRARTATDIIILYIVGRPWGVDAFPSPCTPPRVTVFLGEGSVALARASCVLRVFWRLVSYALTLIQ